MFTGYGKCYRLDALELADEHADDQQHWTCTALRQLRARLADPAFPCLFGRKAVAAQTCHLVFARAGALAADIANGLRSYVELLQPIALKQRIGNPLLVFLQTEPDSDLADQQSLAWGVLQQVHRLDPYPWPDEVARDPHDTQWAFCFNGMPLFINMSFPGHVRMRSRNLGPHTVFVINPRESFDEVASAHSESGRRIRERIRQRVADYNDGTIPASLGFFGAADNYEWQQYQLQEPGSLNPQRCPFRALHADDTLNENEP
ncbi:YqcI/YcgG family protein [Pseudomonas cremoricolorata]|uniref:YqcI/YcgG family protein n=1 Tax=Pseudomonas cremoricolorata TaxID=157783 RepID=A0A089WQ75_9PSED|nr:YqcI/YcgG family protein [Pseudomonas cremoricolorata]AIR90726.1 YqcI/YcgG family protein [Pseudomonas cremoricolorata]